MGFLCVTLRCMQLALIHDLAECIVGDLTPHCGVDPAEKHRREDEAMKMLCDLAGVNGSDLYCLYKVLKTMYLCFALQILQKLSLITCDFLTPLFFFLGI